MSKTVYSKKGGLTPKEKKIVKGIEKFLSTNEEAENNFQTLNNFSELEKYYNENVVSDASFVEINKNEESGSGEGSSGESSSDSKINFDAEHIDVLNKDEPIIRDYVKDDAFANNGQEQTQTQINFSEPLTFNESFEIPTELDDNGKTTGGGSQQSGNKKQKPQPQEPLNPEFDSMKQASKNKSTKRFAKYIVEVTCVLMEKGFVWYATKDITEAALLEKELSGEITLNILLSMEGGQEITVRDFFAKQCLTAEQMAKIDPEEKQDLADALYLVLMEKGVAPTPTQELMLVAFSIVGKQAVNLFAFKAQNNAVLIQLQALRQQGAPTSAQYSSPAPQQQAPPAQSQAAPQQFEELSKQGSVNNAGEGKQETNDSANDFSQILDEKQIAPVTAE